MSIRPAAAQARCGDRAEVIEYLERQYLERPQALGVSSNGKLLEVLVSPNGSWTILVTDSSRMSCLVAAGDGWESMWTKSQDSGA